MSLTSGFLTVIELIPMSRLISSLVPRLLSLGILYITSPVLVTSIQYGLELPLVSWALIM